MKKIIYSIMAVAAITMASCGAEAEETKKEGEAVKGTEEPKQEEPKQEEPVAALVSGTFNTADSTVVTWKAKHVKDTDWAHVGTMLTTGSVEIVENEITTGTFTLDVLNLKEGDAYFEDHMQGEEYFNTSVYPNATFTITSVIDGKVKGTVGVIGMTQEVEFDAEIVVTEESVSVLGAVVIDLLALGVPAVVEGSTLPEDKMGDAPSPTVAVEIDFTLVK